MCLLCVIVSFQSFATVSRDRPHWYQAQSVQLYSLGVASSHMWLCHHKSQNGVSVGSFVFWITRTHSMLCENVHRNSWHAMQADNIELLMQVWCYHHGKTVYQFSLFISFSGLMQHWCAHWSRCTLLLSSTPIFTIYYYLSQRLILILEHGRLKRLCGSRQ